MVNEKIGTNENVVTALIPPGDEIHACGACGGEINIEKDEHGISDQGAIKTVWHKGCKVEKYKNTLLRTE